MTQQEYEKVKSEFWEQVTNIPKEWFDKMFYRAYTLGKQEKDAERSKEKLMCLRDRTKVCNRCHACDIDTDAWHSMYSR